MMADAERRRRNKNIALALILAALVALFYLITIVKMTGNAP
jgi:high-affinity K+ transport system ATPase subunit B